MSEFRVRDFQGLDSSDSLMIERCLQVSQETSGRIIIFEGGEFLIDRAILLPSDTTVILDNCIIRQQDETFDNIFRGANLRINPAEPYGWPLEVQPLRNIKIIGRNGATIAGCRRNVRLFHPHFNEMQEAVGDFWGWRTFLICFSLTENLEIANLAIRDSRCWAISFDFCSNGYVHDLNFDTHCKNGDGVDLRLGCSHFRIENLTGHTLDDTVACTALNNPNPPPRYLYPLEPAKKFFDQGDLRRMDIHDVTIDNLQVSGECHAVICLASGNLQVYNVKIRNITDTACRQSPTVMVYTGYGDGYNPADLHDIQISELDGNNQENVSAFYCNTQVANIQLKGVRQHGSGLVMKLDYPEGIQCL